MSINGHEHRLPIADAERALAGYIDSFAGRAPNTLRLYRSTIRRLFVFLQEAGRECGDGLCLGPSHILDWMTRESRGIATPGAGIKCTIVSAFFRALHEAGRIPADPAAEIRSRFGRCGWRGIARALQAQDREAALDAIRIDSPFRSPLGKDLRAYVELKRSLGARYQTEEQSLADFVRFLRKQEIPSAGAVTPEVVRTWVGPMTCAPITLQHKVRLLGRFFDHLQAIGAIAQNPVTPLLLQGRRTPPSSFRPCILTTGEVAAILDAARRLPAYRRFPLRPQTCHMILALLYGLGLRVGEVRRLNVRDVELGRSTLSIRETKFYKSRLVPFGPRLQRRLEAYLQARAGIFPPLREDDPLFVTFRRRAISQVTIFHTFQKLWDASEVRASCGRRPRVHDLRHSFAVHRLLRWYREGVDVQERLPRLSTFLGHVEIHSTQVYLTITADLLNEANARFYEQFGRLVDAEVR